MESAQWIPCSSTYKKNVLYSVILHTKPLIPASVVKVLVFFSVLVENKIKPLPNSQIRPAVFWSINIAHI